MRAVVLYEHGGQDQLIYETGYRDPEIGPGDVLVRVRASSLNYHDVFTRRGMPGIKLNLPVIPGLDIAGEIAEIGPEVDGWKVGDRIPIIGDIWPRESGDAWAFDLVGIYDNPTEGSITQDLWINYDYFDEARVFGAGLVGWFVVKVTDPAAAEAVAAEIDALFANSTNETKTATEQQFVLSFAKQMGDIGLIMTGILAAVFFTLILLTGNTMAQSIRERIPELAVLKTIGFSNRSVLALVIAESTLLTGVAGAIGLALAALMVAGVSEALASFVPGISFSLPNMLLGFAAALGLGVVVGVLPALQAMRLRIVDAMRG